MSQEEVLAEAQQPPWWAWVQENAQPKNYNFPRPKRELTRWQKRGPMTRRDWVRFYHWAADNAVPRDQREPKPPKKGKKGKAVEKEDKEGRGKKGKGEKPKKKKQKSLAELLERVAKLCEPKNPREKYVYPPTPVYPYAPKISRKEPAHHDPGRPFRPPKVPKCFQHIEIEQDFWNTLRFPVVPAALKYRPSQNVLKLAEPRVVPLPPEKWHCPIPQKVEYIPVRKRMTYRQWVEHQRRLEYLAKPVVRPYYFDPFFDKTV